MSLIVLFDIILMAALLAYTSVSLFKKREAVLLAAVSLQSFVFCIALASLVSKVNILTSHFIELMYIVVGILIPGYLLYMDMKNGLCARFFKRPAAADELHGINDLPDYKQPPETPAGAGSMDQGSNTGQICPIIKAYQPSELLKQLELDWKSLTTGIRRSLANAHDSISAGDYQKAAEIYKGLLRVINNSSLLYFNYGNICYCKGEYLMAAQCFRKASELLKEKAGKNDRAAAGNTLAITYYNLGNTLMMMRRFDQAAAYYEQALKLNEMMREAGENMARAMLAMGKGDEALQHLALYNEKDAESPESLYLYAKLYHEAGETAKAVQELEKCLEKNHKFIQAYELMGELRNTLGEYEKAAECYEALIKLDHSSYAGYTGLGTVRLKMRNFEEAEWYLEKAAAIKPDDGEVHFLLAQAAEECGKLEKAEAEYQTALKCAPCCSQAYERLGRMLSFNGRYIEALKTFTEGLAANPEDGRLYLCMGMTLAGLGRHQEACDSLESAYRLNSDCGETAMYYGAELIQCRRYEDAMEVYRSMQGEQLDDYETLYSIASVYSVLKSHDIALDNLKRAIDINPAAKSDARYNRAFDNIRFSREFRSLVS